jgi:hypothetical protein
MYTVAKKHEKGVMMAVVTRLFQKISMYEKFSSFWLREVSTKKMLDPLDFLVAFF